MKDYFYARAWESLVSASEEEGKHVELDQGETRKAWGVLTLSFSDRIRQKVDTVRQGDVVSLLRTLRTIFYRPTMHTKNTLKDALHGVNLQDHRDLNDLITFIETTCARLESMNYRVAEEDRIYFLLRALPSDYQAAKMAIKLPRAEALTWDQVLGLLRDVAEDPSVPGTITIKKKKNDGVFSDNIYMGLMGVSRRLIAAR